MAACRCGACGAVVRRGTGTMVYMLSPLKAMAMKRTRVCPSCAKHAVRVLVEMKFGGVKP